MPSFAGTDLGPFVSMQTEANPHELQINSYPGVNGLEVLTQGSRGGVTHVRGACYGETLSDLAAAEQQFRSLQANATWGTLVDSTGTSWPEVLMVAYAPVGEIEWVPGYGYGREYLMEFLHSY